MSDTINIWTTQQKNYVNGPGCRFVIWVQGCHLGCSGCWNKHTWSFRKKNLVTADSLFSEITSANELYGVTFTGGEPFVQAKKLVPLARRIKSELGLNLQIFTGFEIHELQNKYQKQLLIMADIVVAGRYDPTKPNNNQKVYEMSDVKWEFNNSDVEIEIDQTGNLLITGYPTDKFISEVKEAVK